MICVYLEFWRHLKKQVIWGLPWWLSGKESAHQCRRHRFDPWFGKIPQATEQLLRLCSRAGEPQLLKPVCPIACALPQEKPPQWEAHALHLESSSYSLQLEKSPHSSREPVQQNKTHKKTQHKWTCVQNGNILTRHKEQWFQVGEGKIENLGFQTIIRCKLLSIE